MPRLQEIAPVMRLVREETMNQKVIILSAIAVMVAVPTSLAASHGGSMGMVASGLVIPPMDATRGRQLFASKGCVVCHSINGVGGEDAAALDAENMDLPMNPFEFSARMWRGAPAMIEAQEDELGAQIEFTGQELADIIAFVHDADEQSRFSEADIPDRIREMMTNMGDDDGHGEDEEHSKKE